MRHNPSTHACKRGSTTVQLATMGIYIQSHTIHPPHLKLSSVFSAVYLQVDFKCKMSAQSGLQLLQAIGTQYCDLKIIQEGTKLMF